jgi:hypothetical protein
MQAATEMMHTAEMHLQEQAAEASFGLICSRLHRHRHNKTPKTGASRSPDKRAYESRCTTHDSGQSLVFAEPYSTLLFTPALRRPPQQHPQVHHKTARSRDRVCLRKAAKGHQGDQVAATQHGHPPCEGRPSLPHQARETEGLCASRLNSF